MSRRECTHNVVTSAYLLVPQDGIKVCKVRLNEFDVGFLLTHAIQVSCPASSRIEQAPKQDCFGHDGCLRFVTEGPEKRGRIQLAP